MIDDAIWPACCQADNGDALGTNTTVANPVSIDGTPEIGKLYAVPARQGRAVRLAKGQTIRVINTHGTQVCDAWAFNSEDLSEYLSMSHMRAWINRLVPKPNDALVSNHRRVIVTLLTDTSPGIHDTQMAACDVYRYTTLGVKNYHDNCADNLRLALRAIGLRSHEVPAPLNLWMNIPIKEDGSVEWLAPVSKPGDYVELRAEMDVIVVFSACPQDIVNINALHPMDVHFFVQ